jgi:hypothetical protein
MVRLTIVVSQKATKICRPTVKSGSELLKHQSATRPQQQMLSQLAAVTANISRVDIQF